MVKNIVVTWQEIMPRNSKKFERNKIKKVIAVRVENYRDRVENIVAT